MVFSGITKKLIHCSTFHHTKTATPNIDFQHYGKAFPISTPFFLQKKRPHKHARKKSCSFGSFNILFKTSLYPTAIQCQNRCMNIFIAILGLRVQLSSGTLHDNCNSLKWLALLGPLPHIYAPLWAYCHYLQAAALRAQRPSISFLP